MDQTSVTDSTARKPARKKDFLILAAVVVLALAAVAVFGFWSQEIGAYVKYRPWQTGEAQAVLDRLHHAAEQKDPAELKNVLHPRATSVDVEKKTISYPAGNGKGSMSFGQLAKGGPFKVSQLEVSHYGQGALMVHTEGSGDEAWGFMMERAPEGDLRVVGIRR